MSILDIMPIPETSGKIYIRIGLLVSTIPISEYSNYIKLSYIELPEKIIKYFLYIRETTIYKSLVYSI